MGIAPTPAAPPSVSSEPDASAILGALASPVVCISVDWRVAALNAAAASLLGVDADEYVGRDFWDVFPSLHEGAAAAEMRAVARDGRPRSWHVSLPGGRADARYELRAARAATGGWLVLELRPQPIVLPMRERDLALESMAEALVLVDAGWIITYCNAAAERFGGVRRSAVVGRTLRDAFPRIADTDLEVACRIAMVERVSREVRSWRPRGDQGDATPVFDARCDPVEGAGISLLLSEVSDLARSERDLAERSRENEMLRDLAHQMAEVPDTDTLLRIVCDVVIDICDADGAGVGELDGHVGVVVAARGADAPVPGTTFPIAGSVAERALRERTCVTDTHYAEHEHPMSAWARAAGITEMATIPLMNGAGPMGVLSVWRRGGRPPFEPQMIERIRMVADHAAVALFKARLLEEAQAASTAKNNFLAAMSHELRTPLTALTGYGELLADEILGPLAPPQRDMVERMRAVTHQLSVMIDDMLTYSSLEAGREQARPKETSIVEILDLVVPAIESMAREKGLQFRLSLPLGAPSLRTDPEKARQILVNLGGNAVKFTERGSVEMAVSWTDAKVCVSVTDSGIGIAPEDRTRLFRPFTQLDGGLTRRHGGTGLGLYISSRLASLVGGSIEVESEPGKGSRFELHLPLDGRPTRG